VNKRYVATILAAFILGGVAGYFVRDLPALLSQKEDLPGSFGDISEEYAGEEVLKITLLREDGTPLTGFEVDLWADGKVEGPPTAAIGETSEDGVATFNLKPGTYWQGFNLTDWPEDLEIPVGQREITVKSGEVTEVTITLNPVKEE